MRKADVWTKINVIITLIGMVVTALFYIFIFGGRLEAMNQDHEYIKEKVKPVIEKKFETDTKFFNEKFDREIQPVRNQIEDLKQDMNGRFDRFEKIILEKR